MLDQAGLGKDDVIKQVTDTRIPGRLNSQGLGRVAIAAGALNIDLGRYGRLIGGNGQTTGCLV